MARLQLLLVGILLSVADQAFATGQTGAMPWDGPIVQATGSLTGPVAQSIGALVILGTGFGVAKSEGGSVMRKALATICGLSIAFTGATWGIRYLGFSGGIGF